MMCSAHLRLLCRVFLSMALCLLIAGCGFGTRFVFSSSEEMLTTPGDQGLPYEDVWFSATDGTALNGWLIPGKPDRPLVLFFHGNAANISHRVENLIHLNEMGFPVFIFGYRGFGLSEGRAISEKNLWQDARGALDWLAGRGWMPEGMIYFGRSMGAAVALQMALERPAAGIVLEAPFTTLSDIAKSLTPVTYSLFGWWSIDVRFDNLKSIAEISSPLLVFHGTLDEVVPPHMSESLFVRAPEPKSRHLVEGAGHSDCHSVGGEEYRRVWLEFAASLSPPPSF